MHLNNRSFPLFRRWLGLLLIFIGLGGAVCRAQLIVERPQGGPSEYNFQDGPVSAAFHLDEPTQILGIYGWLNGSGDISAGITNDTNSLWLGYSFSLETVTDAPAKWQGVNGLHWNLQAGDYRVEFTGGQLPFAYGGPPSTAPQQPTDYWVYADGHWQESSYPFGVRIYGVPLSAVPEPATFGILAALLLGAAVFLRRIFPSPGAVK